MKRDKIISIRVNSKLLNEVQQTISRHTKIYKDNSRNFYYYTDENGHTYYSQYTIADILENAMREYVKKFY